MTLSVHLPRFSIKSGVFTNFLSHSVRDSPLPFRSLSKNPDFCLLHLLSCSRSTDIFSLVMLYMVWGKMYSHTFASDFVDIKGYRHFMTVGMGTSEFL